MAFKSYREESKVTYGKDRADSEGALIEEINCGSLQRIADATEKMALNYDRLVTDRDTYKRWYNEAKDKNKRLTASLKAYKGVVTKLKNKLSLIKNS